MGNKKAKDIPDMSASNEDVDFTTYTELDSFVERRVVLDHSRYGKMLEGLGDIFKDDPNGIYDRKNGRKIGDLSAGINILTRDNCLIEVHTVADFLDTKGDIVDPSGKVCIPRYMLEKMDLTFTKPLNFAAIDLGLAYLGREASEFYRSTVIDCSIPAIGDIVHTDSLEERMDTLQVREMFDRLTDRMRQDLKDRVSPPTWKEIRLRQHRGLLLAEVGLDSRIRKFYHDKFQEELIAEEEERENGGTFPEYMRRGG